MEYTSAKELLRDKLNQPTEEMIKFCMGDIAYELMLKLELMLDERYDLKRELRFWDSWQFGYWHKKAWLYDAIFGENSLVVTMTITDKRVPHMEEIQHTLQPRLQEMCKKFGPSSWPITFEVQTEQDLHDIIKILTAKLPPKK